LVRLLEDKIIGYQDKLWFLPGETVSVYVNSSQRFSAQLYRYGYRVQKVLELGTHSPCLQQVADRLFVAEGLDWHETIQYKIPDSAKPGFYSVCLVSEKNKQESCGITFVVTTIPEKYGRDSKLLVLASTNNWQSYNWWGGRSRYENSEEENCNSVSKGLHKLGINVLPEPIKPFFKKILKRNVITSVEEHPDAWQFRPLHSAGLCLSIIIVQR